MNSVEVMSKRDMLDSASETLLRPRELSKPLSLSLLFTSSLVLLSGRKHYKEYLVDRINKSKLDPLPLYERDGNIEIILKREEKAVPEKEEDETDDQYKERLIEVCLHLYIGCFILSLHKTKKNYFYLQQIKREVYK